MAGDQAEDWTTLKARLLADPAPLLGDAGLLQALGLKIEPPAKVVEFGPAALARLEAARQREMTARQEIEQVARANFAAQAQTHALAVELLEARNNSDLAHRIDEGARSRFGVAAGALAVGGPGPTPAGWTGLPRGLIDMLLGGYAWRLGEAPGFGEIFGDGRAEGLKTAALVRIELWGEGRQGLLAFGSAEPDGFGPEMGGELIAFLAKVVERTAERWPPVA